MAYLTFTGTDDKQNTCFKFIGTNSTNESVSLITGESVGTISLISSSSNSDGGLDTCSFYSGPSDSAIVAFGESGWESCGSVAYASSESCGSIAYTGGGESCGTVASSVSSSSSFSGGCSYSC